MSKQRAFYKWLEECPVEFQFQMEWVNDKDINSMDEMYKFIISKNLLDTFNKWLEQSPIKFESNMEIKNPTTLIYTFRGIPNVELAKEKT